MKYLFFVFCFCLLLSNTAIGQDQLPLSKSAFSIGEVLTFPSKVLQEERVLNIYLPTYYDLDSLKNYPVLYLLDGSADEDFVHIAGLVQFATFPWVEMMPETIIVGIANKDRKRDFTFPTRNAKDKEHFPTSGGSTKFIQFLKEEVQPLIDQQYRTTADKTILGQSLGGLLATEILYKSPELFNRYMIVSPSLWWDDQSLLAIQPKFTQPTEIFIAVGKEGEEMERDAKALAEKMAGLKKAGVNTIFHFLEDQDHANILHVAAYLGFEKLFAKKK